MSGKLADNGKKLAKQGVIAQCLFAIVLIVIVLAVKPEHTIAVVLGSLTFIIPHGFFAYWTFRYSGATKKHLVVQSLSQGLKVKLMLTVVLFVIAFSQFNAAPLPLFGAYVMTMLSQALAMYRLRHLS
jgi:ATP synthase protein I